LDELWLVRKLCRARNRLIGAYPSTVQEIRFLTTHQRGFRHGLFKLLLGALFYWFIGDFFTRKPRRLSLAELAREEPILRLDGCDGGFEYSDAYLHDNDARFVWGFVRSAMDYGCAAANYVESLGAVREGDFWVTRARDVITGREIAIRSRVLINACGPWADAHNALIGEPSAHRHLFSKGIHIIVDRLTPHRRVLTFFADDGRLFFVIPMGPKTCIGTTDTRVAAPEVAVTPEDRRFVLDNINKRPRARAGRTARIGRSSRASTSSRWTRSEPTSPSSAGRSPTASTSARRSAITCARSASPCPSRTASGMASRRSPSARSTSTRPA
jgi:glycerol-3-phosphate dehydrogenase